MRTAESLFQYRLEQIFLKACSKYQSRRLTFKYELKTDTLSLFNGKFEDVINDELSMRLGDERENQMRMTIFIPLILQLVVFQVTWPFLELLTRPGAWKFTCTCTQVSCRKRSTLICSPKRCPIDNHTFWVPKITPVALDTLLPLMITWREYWEPGSKTMKHKHETSGNSAKFIFWPAWADDSNECWGSVIQPTSNCLRVVTHESKRKHELNRYENYIPHMCSCFNCPARLVFVIVGIQGSQNPFKVCNVMKTGVSGYQCFISFEIVFWS